MYSRVLASHICITCSASDIKPTCKVSPLDTAFHTRIMLHTKSPFANTISPNTCASVKCHMQTPYRDRIVPELDTGHKLYFGNFFPTVQCVGYGTSAVWPSP